MSSTSPVKQQQEQILSAWTAAEGAVQASIAQVPRGITDKMAGLAVLAVALTSTPVQNTLENTEEYKEGSKKCVRISFMVVKMLSAGYSSVPGLEDNGKTLSDKKKERLISITKEGGARLHSYVCVVKSKTNMVRGPRMDEYMTVEQGMVFSMAAWEDKIPKVLKNQTRDINPFDLLVVEFVPKSSLAKSRDSMLELRSVSVIPGLSAASLLLAPTTLLPPSIMAHAVRQAELTQSDLTDENSKQEWLRANLSSTVSVVRVIPPKGAVFTVGPDDVLSFYSPTTISDLPPFKTLEVRYDTTLHQPRDWAVRMLNVAALLGGVELLIAVDMYRGKDESRDPTMHAFARVNLVEGLVSKLLTKTPILMGAMPAYISTNLVTAFHMGFEFPDENAFVLIDTRRIVLGAGKKGGANANAGPPSTIASYDAVDTWERGHRVYVYVNEKHIFCFVAATALQCTSLLMPGGACLTERLFEEAIPTQHELLDDVEYEGDTAPLVAAAPPPAKKAKKDAVQT